MSRNQREGFHFGKVNGKNKRWRPSAMFIAKYPGWKKKKRNIGFGRAA